MLKPRIDKLSIFSNVAGNRWSSRLWSSINDSSDTSLFTSEEIQRKQHGVSTPLQERERKHRKGQKEEETPYLQGCH